MTDIQSTFVPPRVAARDAVWAAIASAILLAAFWLKASALLNHDTAWFLYATRRWLAGAVLYRDIVEVNPPLAFFLSAPAVMISQRFAIAETAAMTGYLLALAAFSLAVTGFLLRSLPDVSAAERGSLIAALAFAVALLPAAMFGQREHFLIVFLLPYLALTARRVHRVDISNGVAIAVGAFAALGLCLKPYFMLIPFAVELLIAIRRRVITAWLRPENLAITSVGLAYVMWAVLAYPEFFASVLPWGAEAYVPFYGRDFSFVLLSAMPVAALAALLAYAAWRQEGDDLTGILLATCFAALAAYLVQAKGYLYQLMPATAFCFLAATRLVIARLDRRGSVPAIPALATLFFAVEALTSQTYRYDLPEVAAAVAKSGARSVFLAGVNVSASFPMVNELGLSWSSRFPAQWLLPFAADTQARAAAGEPMSEQARATADYALKSAVDDLIAAPPDVIVVDERKTKDYFHQPFDYIAFYRQDPRFEIFWRAYRPIDRAGSFALYGRAEP